MALNSINPTQTKAWSKLSAHYEAIKESQMKTWFKENPNRADEFTIEWEDFYVDFSKNRITSETLALFIELEKDSLCSFIPIGIHQGFIDHNEKIVVFTDHQIFERYHRFQSRKSVSKSKETFTLKEIYDLQKGDFVVHIDHGVGEFSGLEKIDVQGKEQEAIRLIYKGGDILYVSIHSLHRITKFSGKEGTKPSLNKLGSPAWSLAKQKAKKKKIQNKDNLSFYNFYIKESNFTTQPLWIKLNLPTLTIVLHA